MDIRKLLLPFSRLFVLSSTAKAEDAIVLDNSRMTLNQQMEWIRNLLAEKFGADFQK